MWNITFQSVKKYIFLHQEGFLPFQIVLDSSRSFCRSGLTEYMGHFNLHTSGYLYQMVAQNLLRTHVGINVFSLDLIKSHKQIRISAYVCTYFWVTILCVQEEVTHLCNNKQYKMGHFFLDIYSIIKVPWHTYRYLYAYSNQDLNRSHEKKLVLRFSSWPPPRSPPPPQENDHE